MIGTYRAGGNGVSYGGGPAASSSFVPEPGASYAGGTGAFGSARGANVVSGPAAANEQCCGGYANAGDCAGSLGGAESACCEAAGAVTTTGWNFVGPGRGGYAPVQQYNYVGQGAGSYEKEVTTTFYGWKFRKCCIALMCLLLLPALIYLLTELLTGAAEVPVDVEPQPVVPVAPPANHPSPHKPLHDCATTDLWTLEKRAWCCKHYGKRCTTTHPPTTPPHTTPHTTPPPPPTTRPPQPTPARIPVPIPAPAPVPVHVPPPPPHPPMTPHPPPPPPPATPHPPPPPAAHPPPPPPRPTSLPYDCNADYMDCYHCLMARWSVSKRAWCCAHARRGCATPAPPASLPYDCAAGFNNWVAGWSTGKKHWCCQHQHKGCPTPPPTTSLPYDCGAGWFNWMAGWSRTKKAWCCQHQHKGCPGQPVPGAHPTTSKCPPMDCNVAFNNWRMAWTKQKQAFCCQHEGKACV